MVIPVDPSRLVIHDTSPIVEGSTARESLHRSIELARLGDRLGYRRYWAAELHGMRGAASCAPAVLAGMVASRTSTIRVGAGGVLLPYHAPLVVSEQFGTLEAVHPGRIDLAVGRGAGGPKAAQAAVNSARDDSVSALRTMRLPSPECAAAWRPSGPDEARVFERATAGFVIGDGPTVRRELAELRNRTGADELVVRTPVYDREARLRSFELVAGLS